MADVNHVNCGAKFRIREDFVSDILRGVQGELDVASRLLLPLYDGAYPELHKISRPGVFEAYVVYHVRTVLDSLEALSHVLFVVRDKPLIVKIIELLSHKDSLVALHISRLGETKIVDVVGVPPRVVHPVGALFDYVVLEIVLVDEGDADTACQLRERAQTRPVPFVPAVEVVAAQPVVSLTLPASGERLVVERRPDVGVGPHHPAVGVAAALIPQGREVAE